MMPRPRPVGDAIPRGVKPAPVGETRVLLVTAYRARRVTARMLAEALWTDGQVSPADIAWAAAVLERLEDSDDHG
jgi:hypothetical protein